MLRDKRLALLTALAWTGLMPALSTSVTALTCCLTMRLVVLPTPKAAKGLLVLGVSTLAVVVLALDERHGVAVVGAVPEGLASFEFFVPSLAAVQQLDAS